MGGLYHMTRGGSDRIAIAHRHDRAGPGQCREREKSQDEPEEGEKRYALHALFDIKQHIFAQ